MYAKDSIAYASEEIAQKVEKYIAAGFDAKTAQYFAGGRKRIMAVKASDDFTLLLRFHTGEVRVLDCKPFLKAGTVFEPFMDLGNFRRVYLDATHCVCWDKDPNVDSNVDWMNKVDLCPDTCYMDSIPISEAQMP